MGRQRPPFVGVNGGLTIFVLGACPSNRISEGTRTIYSTRHCFVIRYFVLEAQLLLYSDRLLAAIISQVRLKMETGVSFFLSSLPLWLAMALIVVPPTATAMAAQLLIRKSVGAEKLVKNNEIAGFKFATVGVIYAVLLAFAVIAVWDKFSEAQNSVADEAGATAALFRYSDGPEPEALALQKAIVGYLGP